MFLASNKTSSRYRLIIKIRNSNGAKMVVGDLAGDEPNSSLIPVVESQRTFINSTLSDFYTFIGNARKVSELLNFFSKN